MSKYHVYLISNGLHVKIGKAKDPFKRIVDLQIGSSLDLTVLFMIPYATESEAFEEEAKLQKKFKDKRVRGEWFSLTEEDILAIRTLETEDAAKIARNATTEVSVYLQELLDYGYTFAEIKKTKGVFKTTCVVCSEPLEIRHRGLIRRIKNTCDLCKAPTKPKEPKEVTRSDSYFNKLKKPLIKAHGSKYIYYELSSTIATFSCPIHGERKDPAKQHLLIGCALCVQDLKKDAVLCYQVAHTNTYRFILTTAKLHAFHTWTALTMPTKLQGQEQASIAALFAPKDDYPTIISVTEADDPEALLEELLTTGIASPKGYSYRQIKKA